MRGADHARLAEAERPQRGGLGFDAFVVDLVGDEDHRNLGAAQLLHRRLVSGGRADDGVDHEQNRVRGLHGQLGLPGDRLLQALGIGLPTTGVLHQETATRPARLIRDAVAGHARNILDDGLAAAEDPVHQGRFADVRAADDRDGRHGEMFVLAELAVEIGDLPIGFVTPDAVTGEYVFGHCARPVRPVETCRTTTRYSSSMTSSIFSSLVSTNTASSAGRSGDTVRVESRVSRRCTSANTAS